MRRITFFVRDVAFAGCRRIFETVATIALLLSIASSAFADDRAVCDSGKSAPQDAVAACTRLIDGGKAQGSNRAILHNNRGAGWHKMRDFDRAISDYDQAIRFDSKYAMAHHNRGLAYKEKGNNDRAIADYDQAIRLNPKLVVAYNSRGIANRDKGNFDQAIADYDQVIRLDPKFSVAFFNRGYAWQQKRDLDRAIADYSEDLRLNPRDFVALNNRGGIWRVKGDFDRAIADFDESLRINPSYSLSRNNRGLAYNGKGDRDRAIADFDEAIRLDPKYAAAFSNRGVAYNDKGDRDRAITDFNEAIRLDPKYAPALFYRALAQRQKGELDRALADYSDLMRLTPNDATVSYNRGGIWRSKGQVDRAIADYNETIRLDPSYLAAFTSRGLAYESKGDPDRARTDFNAALALPLKYNNGPWAHTTARARLAVLGSGTATNVGKDKATRLAVVIGNGAYSGWPSLRNPANDARAVGQAFRDIGFETIEGVDLDRTGMERLLRDFLQKASSARIAVVFYAGHGTEIDGKNYMVPIDASRQITRASSSFELIDVDRIVSSLDDEARANIIILDSCRDNPLNSSTGRSAARGGLAEISLSGTSGIFVAFATAPRKTAEDGDGAHSPFTDALLKYIRDPNLEVYQMFTKVRADVFAATQKKQLPYTNSALLGEVYLAADRKAAVAK